MTNLGWIGFRQGNYQNAKNFCQKALLIQRKHNDISGTCFALNNLGYIAHHQGDFKKAKEFHTECLELRKNIGDRRNTAFSLNNLAWTENKLGNRQKALDLSREALNIFSELDERQLHAFALSIKSEILADIGNYEHAFSVLTEKVIPEFREINDTYGIAFSLNCLGVVHFRQKQYSDSLKYFVNSHQIRLKLGDRWGTAQSLCNKVRTQLHLNRKDENLTDSLKNCLLIRCDLEDHLGIAEILEAIAEYFSRYDSMKKAISLAKIASDMRINIHSPRPVETGSIYSEIIEKINELELDEYTPDSWKKISEQKDIPNLLKLSEKILSAKLPEIGKMLN